jgi:periplasmic protein CpxP/Spy
MINNQNKNKVFLLIIAILFIANIAMLAFFLQKKDGGDRSKRPDIKAYISNFLAKEIGFNSAQLAQYDTLSNRNREKMGSLFEKIRNTKNEQFKQLVAGNFSDSTINLVADQSAANQKLMEMQMFNHIKSIRQLCTPDQLPKFDTLFIKVFNRRTEGRKKTTK